jgi:putative PEP-CTERM system histidine kinase
MSPHAAVASHALAGAAFLLLAAALLQRWRDRAHAGALAAASLASAVWAATAAAGLAWPAAETVRSAAWAAVMLVLLAPSPRRRRGFMLAVGLLTLAALVLPPGMALYGARLLLAVLGMLLVEQRLRATPGRALWSVKFACIGIGALFAYDFFLYCDAMLIGRASADMLAARGLANALSAPLLALAAARNPRWDGKVGLSRSVLFHSLALAGSAAYLLAMASSAWYLRAAGGDWGRLMQLTFLCGACIALAALLLSGSLRARVKVFINKHFYTDRFDYRAEWLRITRVLSEDGPDLGRRSVEAVAGLVESPGGALWLRREGGCEPAAAWNMALPPHPIDTEGALFRYMEAKQWVVDVAEWRARPQRWPGLELPPELQAMPRLWLLVPLMLHGRLFGIVALTEPRVRIALNWEVRDVLKIAGSQAAGYLAHRESLDSLLVARQFESFSRMSTFIMHDLKNLVFQFSLMLDSAERHKHNPQFQADMLGTLDHSVQKMKNLLQKLARGEVQQRPRLVLLCQVLERAVQAHSLGEPRPRLELHAIGLAVRAHAARLERVVGHLLQNAIEATPCEGEVTVRLWRDGASAIVEVADTGSGMDPQFVRERLFRPFDSTKRAGMGIGVFESREYAREIGGRLEVESVKAAGSTFRLVLPLCLTEEARDGQEEAVGD